LIPRALYLKAGPGVTGLTPSLTALGLGWEVTDIPFSAITSVWKLAE
jgi:hypothetical protein